MPNQDATERSKHPGFRKKKLPAVVKWLRTAGTSSLLIGFGGGVRADRFWIGAGLCYLGFAAFAVDVWFEPEWGSRLKVFAWGIIVLVAAGFSWAFVFVNAPLGALAIMTDGDYPVGTTIAGIKWRPEFTEVTVDLTNRTDQNYEDLNLVIRPSVTIARIAEKTSFGCLFSDKNGFDVQGFYLKNMQTGAAPVLPLVVLASDAGYRMRCANLPAGATIQVVTALAHMKWNPTPPLNIPLEQRVQNPNYVVKVRIAEDHSTYWLGYENGDDYAPRISPSASDWVIIDGSYLAEHRRIRISKKLEIGGRLPIARSE